MACKRTQQQTTCKTLTGDRRFGVRIVSSPLSKTEQRRLLTVSDVAQWLSVSPSLVYQLVDAGKLIVYRVGNGRGAIRFRPDDVEAYLASCRQGKLQPQCESTIRLRLKHIRKKPR